MPLVMPPPRGSRFGSPLVLSRVHRVGPKLAAEVTYLEWTDDRLLPQVVYSGTAQGQAGERVRPDGQPSRGERGDKEVAQAITIREKRVSSKIAALMAAGIKRWRA